MKKVNSKQCQNFIEILKILIKMATKYAYINSNLMI